MDTLHKERVHGVYIPKDLADAFIQLNILIDKSSQTKFKNMEENEQQNGTEENVISLKGMYKNYFLDFSGNDGYAPVVRKSDDKEELLVKIPEGNQKITYKTLLFFFRTYF